MAYMYAILSRDVQEKTMKWHKVVFIRDFDRLYVTAVLRERHSCFDFPEPLLQMAYTCTFSF